MSTYVLVHGAWMGAWCWYKVKPLLEQAGHTVITPDLPAHGDDQTPVNQANLQSYTDRIVSVLDAQAEPVVLVGHSMAGTVVSQVTEACPAKIKNLIYLTAYLLPNGESILTTAPDPDSLTLSIAEFRESEGVLALRPDGLPAVFLNDCSQADIDQAIDHLRPEPLGSNTSPVIISEANYGRVPRFYIHCTQDRVITPPKQAAMLRALPSQEFSIDTGHCAFFSKPQEVADILLSLS